LTGRWEKELIEKYWSEGNSQTAISLESCTMNETNSKIPCRIKSNKIKEVFVKRALLILLALTVVMGCGKRKVTRLETDTVTDLSGRWNDTDSRLVAEEMISDCLSRVWLSDFNVAEGRKPVVTVGTIRNRSSEHINTETFSKDFERELLNSGKVKFVASREQRGEVRDERLDQQEFASLETAKRMAQETGADFLLYGDINTIQDELEGTRVMYYQTDLELINIETNEKVWIGTKKIKKEITKGGTKW